MGLIFVLVRYIYIPSGVGAVLLKDGLVVLRLTGAIPTTDEVCMTENSPSFLLLIALRNAERTQSSVTIDEKFTAKSTSRLPQL